MSQTEYKFNMEVGQPGLLYDIDTTSVLSYNAAEAIQFGFGLVQGASANQARLAAKNLATVTFDADFVTDNEIVVDVNGVTVGPVIFDTDQATTIAALAAAISALENVNAVVSGVRELSVTRTDGEVIVDNIAVTAGASQANGSVAYSAENKFIGVAIATQAMEQNLSGEAFYSATQTVSVLTRGRIYVYVEQDVTVRDSVFLRHTANGAGLVPGQFRKDADSNNAVEISGARFITDAAAGSVAVLEINLPN